MIALYVLIPAAIAIVAGAIWLLFWAVDNGQYEDLESPAHSLVFDGEEEKRQLAAAHTPQPQANDHVA